MSARDSCHQGGAGWVMQDVQGLYRTAVLAVLKQLAGLAVLESSWQYWCTLSLTPLWY
jgi:hypothetical protein